MSKAGHRIEVASTVQDMRAEVRKRKIDSMGINLDNVNITDVFTLDPELEEQELSAAAARLSNPITQETAIDTPLAPKRFDYAVEIGLLPGVTDNVGNTAREIVEDLTGKRFDGQAVYTSQVMFLSGLERKDAVAVGEAFSNPVIQRASVKSFQQFQRDKGMGLVIPKVRLQDSHKINLVDILHSDDSELQRIGKMGIVDHKKELAKEEYLAQSQAATGLRLGDFSERDGRYFIKERRGPLALDITYMKTIQTHFGNLKRNPTDIELESIAQRWSEHCKHTIFADPIDEIKDGLFRHYIKRATQEIRKRKGEKDFCVSVFTDNAGGIVFDDEFLVCDKVETHNAPSALDPFGGSITGIVGVNRDPMGFGLGAKPIVNRFGFCFGDLESFPIFDRSLKGLDWVLYRDKAKKQKMLSPERIMDGVIEGVQVGGNCSGIPTTQGFLYFDKRYRGKPLVFVGTLGFIPRTSAGRESHEKKAEPGDYIVMVGGRVGKDGIHGATFSSEALDSGSPVTAVQIGDPITQKKMSDATVKEARDRKLYRSITDNGAGGLSCSVGEMGNESGGYVVNLDKVPLKYPGLRDDEIWVSESQERMTLAVPKETCDELLDLYRMRGVEATVIGEFTDSGRAIVKSHGKTVMDLDMNFLDNGLPPRPMKTSYTLPKNEEPDFECLDDLTDSLLGMLARPNITSFEFISQQYDHEVQGGSVIKPLQGRGRVNGDATVVRPRLDSKKALVLSHGINPSYSDIDTYHMAACAIDTAVRNAVAAGADLEHLALLDNFCWCSSTEPERLGQLKRAAQACYDTATEYDTPFISGKDSMFNDFNGFDENGNPVKISVPPTLLVSSLAVIKDAEKAVSIDAKVAGDLVYVLGFTHKELGGSEYFAMKGEQLLGEKFIGNSVPKVDTELNKSMYQAFSKAVKKGLVASAVSVIRGGLGIALAKSAIAGQLGIEVDMNQIASYCMRNDDTLYSESQGRLVVTVNPEYREKFETAMGQNMIKLVGKVRGDNKFLLVNNGRKVIDATLEQLTQAYKSTFKEK